MDFHIQMQLGGGLWSYIARAKKYCSWVNHLLCINIVNSTSVWCEFEYN
jgi:hypothetical protein